VDIEWRRVAAYVVCREGAGRLLLTRFVLPGHPDSGKWTMPGGEMEWGESVEATAVRERHEESGLDASIGSVLGVFSRWYSDQESVQGKAGHVVGIVLEATPSAGELRVEFDAGTTDAAGWFTVDEIRELPHDELVDFVLDLIS
jgi:ADP-ribose pyrophosphatase YjhB (NUDIX family)